MRVVSLLPSATELLCFVGGGDLLVGRSHECDYPTDILDCPVLTSQTTEFTTSAEIHQHVSDALAAGHGLYRLDETRLHDLKPDAILTQDLCSVCSIDLAAVRRVAASMRRPPEVLSLNPRTLEDVFDDVLRVGRAIGRQRQAEAQLVALRDRFFRAADHVTPYVRERGVLFLEWTDPPFVGGHWTPQLIERAGARSLLNPTRPMAGAGSGAGGQMAHRTAGPSRQVTPEEIVAADPEVIIVCPCGLGIESARRELDAFDAASSWWRSLSAVAAGRVAIVDGSHFFNRPGPRLVDAYEWLVGWLNDRPELIPEGFRWELWR